MNDASSTPESYKAELGQKEINSAEVTRSTHPLTPAEQAIVDQIDKKDDPGITLQQIISGEDTPNQPSGKESERYSTTIQGLGKEIATLWKHIPQDKRENDSILDELSETYNGDVDKFIASKLHWYQNNFDNDHQSWGKYQVMNNLNLIKNQAVLIIGKENADKIVAESHAKETQQRHNEATTSPQPESDKQPASEGAASEATDFLKQIKRPYTVEDVQVMQDQFKQYENDCKLKNKAYVVNENDFYRFLTSRTLAYKPTTETSQPRQVEKEEDPQDYDLLILNFYNNWRENIIKNRDQISSTRPSIARHLDEWMKLPVPQTADELRDLYRLHPELNNLSAVSYQDGISADHKQSAFLHFFGHRYNGYSGGEARYTGAALPKSPSGSATKTCNCIYTTSRSK